MRTKPARLPPRKGLEEFDFSFQPSIDKRQIDELATLAFAARAENVILLGPPGVGKTHLAVGISMKAVKALKTGLTVYYTSLARLIEDLKRALEQNRLASGSSRDRRGGIHAAEPPGGRALLPAGVRTL